MISMLFLIGVLVISSGTLYIFEIHYKKLVIGK